MKALVYTQPCRLQLMDWQEPEPREDQVLLEIEGTGICGSDMAGYLGRSSRRVPPLILGHEVVGFVKAAPPGATVKPGDRVVVNPLQSCGQCAACSSGHTNRCADWKLLGMDREQGGFAERVVVTASNVFPIARSMPLELAVMVEPLANTVHVMGMVRACAPKSMLIIGAGTQGTLAVTLARRAGVERLAVAETNAERLALAAQLGADLCVDPNVTDVAPAVRQWSDGGVDLVLEAVGSSATREEAIRAVRKGGKVILLGLHDQTTETDYASVVRNEITLAGSFAYTRQDFAASLELLSMGALDIANHVRVMPLERGQDAFEKLRYGPGRTLKIVLVP